MSRADQRTIRRIFAGAPGEAEAASKRVIELADREGLADVAYASFDSPIGTGHVAATERGIVAVGLPNRAEDDFLAELATEISPRVLELSLIHI